MDVHSYGHPTPVCVGLNGYSATIHANGGPSFFHEVGGLKRTRTPEPSGANSGGCVTEAEVNKERAKRRCLEAYHSTHPPSTAPLDPYALASTRPPSTPLPSSPHFITHTQQLSSIKQLCGVAPPHSVPSSDCPRCRSGEPGHLKHILQSQLVGMDTN